MVKGVMLRGNLDDLLASLGGDDAGDGDGDGGKPLLDTQKEALCMTLREIYARYVGPCPFQPGDLVTPRAGYNYKGCGDPQVVLEVLDPPLVEWDAARGTVHRKCDIKIAVQINGVIAAVLAESFVFQAYEGDGAAKGEGVAKEFHCHGFSFRID